MTGSDGLGHPDFVRIIFVFWAIAMLVTFVAISSIPEISIDTPVEEKKAV